MSFSGIKDRIWLLTAKVCVHLLKRRMVGADENRWFPFFILSSGRSGSTMLRKQLMLHAKCHIPPESNDIIVKGLKKYIKFLFHNWNVRVAKVLDVIFKDEGMIYWNLNKAEILNFLVSTPKLDQNYSYILQHLYLQNVSNKFENLSIGDKTPYLLFRLPWLKLLFPKSKFIFIIRDGRDVISSMLKFDNYNINLACSRWITSTTLILDQKVKSNTMTISYETLVQSPQYEIDKIIDFLGLVKRSDESLALDLGDDILSHHFNIKNPINRESIGKWKSEMNDSEKSLILSKIKSILKKAGYTTIE